MLPRPGPPHLYSWNVLALALDEPSAGGGRSRLIDGVHAPACPCADAGDAAVSAAQPGRFRPSGPQRHGPRLRRPGARHGRCVPGARRRRDCRVLEPGRAELPAASRAFGGRRAQLVRPFRCRPASGRQEPRRLTGLRLARVPDLVRFRIGRRSGELPARGLARLHPLDPAPWRTSHQRDARHTGARQPLSQRRRVRHLVARHRDPRVVEGAARFHLQPLVQSFLPRDGARPDTRRRAGEYLGAVHQAEPQRLEREPRRDLFADRGCQRGRGGQDLLQRERQAVSYAPRFGFRHHRRHHPPDEDSPARRGSPGRGRPARRTGAVALAVGGRARRVRGGPTGG